MASPSQTPNTNSNPNPSPNPNQHFEIPKLFRPPNPNPSQFYGTPATGVAPQFASPPLPPTGPFSYPPATPPFHHRAFLPFPQDPIPRPVAPYPNPSPNANPGARLMQLLGNTVPATPLESTVSMPPPSSVPLDFAAAAHMMQAAPPLPLAGPTRVPSIGNKIPRGRHIAFGDRAVYDVDERLPGESEPPQLEVTPITKYSSDPAHVLGRQIAVNKSYIVYGLRSGNIRVLNINTALRALFRGHTERDKVTDMAFFAEDVHLLASASIQGKIYVWRIDEGLDEENKPQVTGKVVVALQIVGERESCHPRICWHSHKQEILFVGIENQVLRIDATKIGRGKKFSAEEPLTCPLDKLIDGVHLVGKHDGDISDLSISQWMITRLASASMDGTVKIWDDRNSVPLAVWKPHDGLAVNALAFLTAPDHPDHINLITAGPLNREVKIWTSVGEGGWLLPSDSESWRCTQTLELRSSSEPNLEEAFFNHVCVLPQASLILLANAKRNAIYAVHVDYGTDPASTRMDYIADFIVTMPILSLTGTNEYRPDGRHVVQIYCFQTFAIQQYALDMSLCLPPTTDLAGTVKEPSTVALDIPADADAVAEQSPRHTIDSSAVRTPKPPPSSLPNEIIAAVSHPATPATFEVSNLETRTSGPALSHPEGEAPGHTMLLHVPSQNHSENISNVLERGSSIGSRDAEVSALVSPVECRSDVGAAAASDTYSRNEHFGRGEQKPDLLETSLLPNPRQILKRGGNSAATHVSTSLEILSGASPSNDSKHVNQGLVLDMMGKDDTPKRDIEVKAPTEGNMGISDEMQNGSSENRTNLFVPSEPKIELANESSTMVGTSHVKDSKSITDKVTADSVELLSGAREENIKEIIKDIPDKVGESSSRASDLGYIPVTKEEKTKQLPPSADSSPSVSPFHSIDSLNMLRTSSIPPIDGTTPQYLAMQDMLTQLITMQKDLQKQLSTLVAVPVTKEGKRIEASLGRNMEKSIKANVDALWAHIQEENAKREKLEKERVQQLNLLVTNSVSKDLPALLEKILKKEFSGLGATISRSITPVIEKTISSVLAESFQKVVSDKLVNQLDKSVSSKVEASMARHIQTQFQTLGKHAIQETLRSCFEQSVIPAFEQSCKAMFDQVDIAFHKGMSEHTSAVLQQVEAAHTPLVLTLKETISSASSITQNMKNELLEGQQKLLSLVAAGGSKGFNPSVVHPPMGGPPEAEAPIDPTKELSRLITERKFEEAFTMALNRSDFSLVSWLCTQVDLHLLCSMVPLPLNQGVLIALLQQLAYDIGNDTSRKVLWMTDVAVAINPHDPLISMHVRPIFEQVYNILNHQRSLPSTTASDAANFRIIMHVLNSVLLSYK